jgi:DNA-binding GntR family transcriptional regulator
VTVPFDNLTLSQRVYEHLRDEILADRLLPGTELSEVALSRELAVSRGPIREAMGRLAAEGLITMRPRRRAEVRSLTPQELIDAYQVREALEVMAVRLLISRVTEADYRGWRSSSTGWRSTAPRAPCASSSPPTSRSMNCCAS